MNETNAGGVRQRSVEIVVPVHNEAHVLGDSIGRLHAYLEASFPFPFRITVADNASTDATWQAATGLTARLPHVHAVRLEAKGRGRALKYVWSRSEADVVAYMDVDLSTGLDGFLPLVAPLLSGHSDLAIGSRLHRQADVVRGPKREFISRSYNLLLKLGLAARFSDAQCGFKAVRTEVFRALAPHIEDNTWFFDTELLVLAERNRLRIHEVPVDWVDDPDSRVDIVATAVDDLKGMGRMQRRILTGRTRVALPPRAGTAHVTAATRGAASVEPCPGGGGNHASAERTSPATGAERMSPAAGAERTSPAAGAAAPPARARAA
ncbi:glycosyltransferase [Streptomyces olivochromogenes]|uniref:glycosyltransferase n=1 Tax=Streptomyces olivochromogenes TaxID=1963 RepID=UPI003687C303